MFYQALRHKGEREPLLSALTGFFEEWVRREHPQKVIEKGLDQLVSLFECDGVSDPATMEARGELRKALLAAREPAGIPHALAAAFDAALLRRSLRLDLGGIAEEVEERILWNSLSIQWLSGVSSHPDAVEGCSAMAWM